MLHKVVDFSANYDRGFLLPSYHESIVTFLKNEAELVDKVASKRYDKWKSIDCKLMSDGWIHGRSTSFINFLMNMPSETIFLKSIGTLGIYQIGEELFKLLDFMIRKVGKERVIQ